MVPSTSLNFRLLCACGAAYDVAPGACVYVADKVYSPVVNYTSGPTAVCGEFGDISSCLVGQNQDGIIVSFRGTLPLSVKDPLSILDWLQNFFAEPTTAPNLPGQVHSGFYDAVSSVITGVATAVKALGPSPTNKVLVTGHSLGGAMASMAAYILNKTYGFPIQQVVTFASPKPGDPAFKAGYEAVIANQIRYENYEDIVPLLPPELKFMKPVVAMSHLKPDVLSQFANLFSQAQNWNYVPVGSELFIEADKHTINPNEPIDAQVWDVIKELVEDALEVDFSSFLAAHTINPGGGYYTALSASVSAAAS